MATGTIDYETISTMLTKFKNLQADFLTNNQNAEQAIKDFQNSGFSTNLGQFSAGIDSLITKFSNSTTVLDNDYNRIIAFLNKVVDNTKAAHSKTISTAQASEVWKATETVTKS